MNPHADPEKVAWVRYTAPSGDVHYRQAVDYESASKAWRAIRGGAGYSEVGDAVEVLNGRGETIARVAYNGRVFPPGPWAPGQKALWEPG
jgi:hypothetical protein